MSPRLSTGPIATRLSSGALLLAMLLSTTAMAQDVPIDVPVDDGLPYSTSVDSSSYLGQTPLRVALRTRGYGEETTETALGTHWATPLTSGLAYIDGQFRVGNSDTDFSANLGVGFRWRNDDFFGGSPRIFGVSVWYDGEDTKLDNFFNQIGISFERLGPAVDLRLNANIPLEETKQSDNVTFTGDTVFIGNSIAQGTLVDSDVALRVVDFEIAPRIFNLNAWFYAGGYQMDGVGVSEFGEKGGVRGYITNDLVLDVGVTDDDQFGTNTIVQVIWTPGRVTADPSWWSHNIDDRMREQVYRNAYVAVEQTVTAGTATLTDAQGDAFRVVHVDSTAAAGGDGTIERPLNNLNDINGNSQVGDIVLAHSGSTFTGQSATIKDAQRFLGEGDGLNHTIVTSQLGTVNLPASSPGAIAGVRPIIQNSSGAAAVVLNGGNDSVEDLAGIEVSNFTITGGTRAVFSPNGVGDVNINHLAVTGTTGNGIDLKALVETLADDSTRSRFRPTISDVTFNNVGTTAGDDIHLDGATTETTILEAISIRDFVSGDTTAGHGVGINLQNTKRAATIADVNWDGGTTGLGAVRIENAIAQAGVTVGGTNVITGGVSGVANQGYAIALVNSAGTHTFNETTVTDTGGDSVIVSAGTASLQFRGLITQGNDASVVSVTDHTTGTLSFLRATSSVAGSEVIRATNGDGLQFVNADGTYTFTDKVTLNTTDGGQAGIDVLAGTDVTNGSQGRFTFSNVDIDFSNTTADLAAVAVDGSTPVNFNLAGDIDVTNGRPIAFTNNKGGDFAITATITGTDEEMFIDGNTGGTYAFTSAVNMDTSANASNGVEITDNSGGSTSFNNLIIETSSGTGLLATNDLGHTLTITGTGNTITTDTGVGLNLNTLAVGTGGVNFASVNVANGATNAIILNNLTGGAVTIGTAAGDPGSGGTMITAGNAINITNAVNVSLNQLNVTSSGGIGINYSRPTTATATSRLTLNGNTVTTGAGGQQTIRIAIDGSNQANFTITGNTVTNGNGNEAMLVTSSGSGVKDIRFLMNASNSFTNNSATAQTVDFQAAGSGSFNSTITNNFFINNSANPTGRAFEMASTGAATSVRLNLDANNGTSANANDFLLQQTAGTFTVLNDATVSARNPGGVEEVGTITNDAGPIPQPQ